MAKWRLAKSLIRLRDQINQVAPNRSKLADGSIGDAAHASRSSDHNPWFKDAAGIGVVTAIDVTHDPSHGLDGSQLSESLTNDPRTKYVIFAGRIWKARTGKWESYFGPNSHHHHVHLSVKPDIYDDQVAWKLNGQSPSPSSAPRPLLKLGSEGDDVKYLQAKLGITVDGNFGFGTERAVKRFQLANGLTDDGKVGPSTWAKLEKI